MNNFFSLKFDIPIIVFIGLISTFLFLFFKIFLLVEESITIKGKIVGILFIFPSLFCDNEIICSFLLFIELLYIDGIFISILFLLAR